jgi:16S rRNA (cytosine967-C5)-methyltransferase
MTPGARISAAMEILDAIFSGRRAADIAMTDWARANRYAGSSDRRMIEARVFTALRRRNACLLQVHGQTGARALVLGSLRLEGLGAAQIEALGGDGPHAFGPLSAAERASLGLSPQPSAGPWDDWDYPHWLHGELALSLGDDLAAEMEAAQARAPLDLRVNALRGTREDARAALGRDGVEADPLALAPHALRVRGHAKLESLDAHRSGLIEVQDAASQAVCHLLDPRPGERIVDLCAGAGGKALAMAALMGNQGVVLACDVDGKRLGRLAPRAVRCGATIIEMTGDPYAAHPHLTQGSADAVLVDAPCSGSGTWRRNPEAKWTLDAHRLASYRAAQAQALDRGLALTRPGGRLVYAVCSLLRSEGEEAVEAALARTPGWRLAGTRRFSPASTGTDGFFAAHLSRLA